MTEREVGYPKVIIAKPGLDGHDRGAKVVARALKEAEMNVVYTGIRHTPDAIVEMAIEKKADVLGISILSGSHLEHLGKIVEGLRLREVFPENNDILLLVGGIIPDADMQLLKDMGVHKVFTPGTNTNDIVEYIFENTKKPQT